MVNSQKTKKMVQLAFFTAIIVMLAYTPLGYIPLGPVRATTIHIPVILGGILLGPMAGGFLGGVFGLTSFINNTISPTVTSFVFTPFYSLGDFSGGFWSIVICFVPRILIGVIAALVFRAIAKIIKNTFAAAAVAGFIGSMVNTVLVMGGIYVFFGESYALARETPVEEILAVIGGVIAVNGVMEAISASVITAAVTIPLLKMFKNTQNIKNLKVTA